MVYQVTTTESWEVDGIPLSTYAWNVTSLGGRLSTPGLRGSNVEMAYRPGAEFRPKVAASRSVNLGMWVTAADPNSDTGLPAGADPRASFMSNLRFLQKLFYQPGRQLSLKRKWTDLSGSYEATAKAQLVSAINPVMNGRLRATFVVDLLLADPFYYGAVQNVPISGTTVLTNPGDDFSPKNLVISFTGGTNPRLTNNTPSPVVYVQYTGTVSGTLVVEVSIPRARIGSTVVNSAITSSGSMWWMQLFPGINSLTLTGGGTCSVAYTPVYI